ncbi:MAG: nitroreductase family protein [Pyrinomonadaceae bacterium]|nr:nitroreductase family protein [Pyrinomonadaceae bacterium]
MKQESSIEPVFIKHEFAHYEQAEARRRVAGFYRLMNARRSVRDFSSEAVEFEIIEQAIATAGTAPSGANMQPWRFVVVKDNDIKRRIREAAEHEERLSYEGRMPERWLRRLAPLGTDWHKPFLEIAPYLIVVFRIDSVVDDETGEREPTYYAAESVGIAVGLLLAALHTAGLATLTHTPSPMKFLGEILGRPKSEKAFVLIPVGFPAENVRVPDIERKPLNEIMSVI